MRWRMARYSPGRARGGARVLGAAMLLAGAATLGAGTVSGAEPARQDETNPLTLFSAMMPVFSSPRCVNCHGGVQPATGDNHEGGKVDVKFDTDGNMENGTPEAVACLECHTAADKWRTAPRALSFVGKDAPTLCRQIRASNDLTGTDDGARQAFIFHLSEDYFVGLAFEGKRAVGDDSPFGPLTAAPPPMSREDFVGAAQTWLLAGQARCGQGWSGTIDITKTSQSHAITQGNTVESDAAMELKIAIKVDEGEATANVVLKQHDWADSGPKNHDCTTQHLSYAIDESVPANVQIFVDIPTVEPEQIPAVSESGGAQIFVTLPPVAGTATTERSRNGPTGPSTCITTQRQDPYTLTYEGASGRGPVDPDDVNHVTGQQVSLSPDGTVTTTVKWNLARGE